MRGPNRIALFHRPPSGLGDVGDEHVGMRLARPPDLEVTGDAERNEGAAGFEFRVPGVLD